MYTKRFRTLHAIITEASKGVQFRFKYTNIDGSQGGVVFVGALLTFDVVELNKFAGYDVTEGDCIGVVRMNEDGTGFSFTANTKCGLVPSELQYFQNLLYAGWEKEMAIKKELESNA